MPEPEGDWSPRVAEWTLAHALQYDQRAVLVAILRTLQAANGVKNPKPVPPLPAPRTLLDEVRDDVRAAARRARIDELKYSFGYRPR